MPFSGLPSYPYVMYCYLRPLLFFLISLYCLDHSITTSHNWRHCSPSSTDHVNYCRSSLSAAATQRQRSGRAPVSAHVRPQALRGRAPRLPHPRAAALASGTKEPRPTVGTSGVGGGDPKRHQRVVQRAGVRGKRGNAPAVRNVV